MTLGNRTQESCCHFVTPPILMFSEAFCDSHNYLMILGYPCQECSYSFAIPTVLRVILKRFDTHNVELSYSILKPTLSGVILLYCGTNNNKGCTIVLRNSQCEVVLYICSIAIPTLSYSIAFITTFRVIQYIAKPSISRIDL